MLPTYDALGAICGGAILLYMLNALIKWYKNYKLLETYEL